MIVAVLLFVIIGVMLLLGWLSIEQQYQHHQKSLASRAAAAEKGLAAEGARIALLESVLPRLVAARQGLHSEVVELVGTRAEFSHTLATARAYKEGSTQGADEQRAFERTQYKHATDLRRLQNQLVAEIDRAALRPLRVEAQRTRLRVEANERVVENILTQQAIEEARNRKRGASPKANKLATLRSELGTLVEQFKADGKEVAGLEAALETLPDDQDEEN